MQGFVAQFLGLSLVQNKKLGLRNFETLLKNLEVEVSWSIDDDDDDDPWLSSSSLWLLMP